MSKLVHLLLDEEHGSKLLADNSCLRKASIQNHQIAIERQRKMLNLIGDSIVLALLSNIELRNNHSLTWKN